MSEQPQANTYRLVTMFGQIIDFTSPNDLPAMWTIIRGDGFFQLTDTKFHPVQRIPYHAIASLAYHDPSQMLAQIPAASGAKN